jgi:hypothetical protein
MKLTARKHIRAPPRRNVVPTEAHNDGQDAGYFSRTLRTVLLALGSSEPPALHRGPEAAAWKLVPLVCTCGDLREAYDQSYLPHRLSGRRSSTEVVVRGRHERGSP